MCVCVWGGGGACDCVSLRVSICDYVPAVVSEVGECLKPGESAGLALVMLTEGRHFRGSRTPWHQSPQSPRQTGSIWALSAPLAPADSDLYDGGEEWIGSGRGENMSQIPLPASCKCMLCQFAYFTCACVCLVVLRPDNRSQ